MVIREAINKGRALLKCARIESASLDANVLMCTILSCGRTHLIMHEEDELSLKNEEEYFSLIKKRSFHTPVAYLTHTKEFMGLEFYVDENVLIPRPDTETLCELVIGMAKPGAEILDLCSGSGCIGLSLAHYIKDSKVTLCDISRKALEISGKNAASLGIDARFVNADVLSYQEFGVFDVIVSNPPYIKTETIELLESDVKDFEPAIALDGGSDGLVFYRFLSSRYEKNLKKGGIIAFEVGFDQAAQVSSMLKNTFGNAGIAADLSGIDRVVYSIK